MSGAVLLGQLVGRLEHLDVACSRCPRSGRLYVARLVAKPGASKTLSEMRHVIAADCPLEALGTELDQRGVHIVKMRWGKIVDIDANEGSQAISENLKRQAALGVEEATGAPIVS